MTPRPLLLAALLPALAAAQAEPGGVKLGAAPPAAKPHRLAVLDFSLAGSAHPDLARVLADAAAQGAAGAPGWVVLSQGDMVALLGLERSRQMLGCTEDQGCMAELAGALDSDRLLAGSLTILERTALVTVRLLDVKKARTLARASATLLDATERELVDAARRAAHEAVTGERLDTTGSVRVAVDRPGATVTLDGKRLGESPLPEAVRVPEGPHQVVVQKQGFVRWSTSVQVPAGQAVPVQVELVQIQLMGEAARSRLWGWGWASAGVAVAGGAAALWLGARADALHADYRRATTRTEAQDLRDRTTLHATLANVSWGVAGAAALGAGWLLGSAMVADARAEAPAAAVVPIPGGAALAVQGRF
jgi:hypothetical protein